MIAGMSAAIKQTMLVTGATFALIVAGVAVYFLAVYPGFLTLIPFSATFPVFLILGLGLFRLTRRGAE